MLVLTQREKCFSFDLGGTKINESFNHNKNYKKNMIQERKVVRKLMPRQ